MKARHQKWKETCQSLPLQEGLAAHKENQKEIRDFLLFGMNIHTTGVALTYSWYKMERTELETLWEVWVKEPMAPGDQDFFYAFLRKVVNYGSLTDYMQSVDDTVKFFSAAVCNETNDYSGLSVDAMQTLEAFMVAVNQSLGNLACTVKPQGPQFILASSEPEIEVKIVPSELRGINILWKIALEAKNEDVAVLAIEALNKFHTRLDAKLEDQMVEISTRFIETAAEKLVALRSGEGKEKEIIKLLKLIEEMIDESERKGNGGLAPLYALSRTHALKLRVVNKFSVASTDLPAEFELVVSTSATCWQVKMLISQRLRISPDSVS